MTRAVHDPSRYVAFGAVIALHALAIAGLLAVEPLRRVFSEPAVVEAVLFFAPAATEPESLPEVAATTAPALDLPVVDPVVVPVSPADAAVTGEPDEPPASMGQAIETPRVNADPPLQTAPPTLEGVEYMLAPTPRYPPIARRLREEGIVWLRVLVDDSGRAAEVSLLHSSGSPRLDEEARRAVSAAVFRPHRVGGNATPAYVRVPIEFSLRRG